MDKLKGYIFIHILLLTNQVCYSVVRVSLSIDSYSNPNGTAYKDSSSDRKCCDGPQRATCNTGDTCDTYFNICVGRFQGNACNGAFFNTKPLKDTNNITNMPPLQGMVNNWTPGTSVFVFINDDDPQGAQSHDHIDTLIQEVKFAPDSYVAPGTPHVFQWLGKTSLTISVIAVCGNNYYGDNCNVYCQRLAPMVWCSSLGKLMCSSSDEVLIEFRQNTLQSDYPMLDLAVNNFVKEQVCVGAKSSQVQYPKLDTTSNTFAFIAYCDEKVVTAFQLEALLNSKSDALLNSYFRPGVLRGHTASIKGYGEHIVPNVYVGIEVLSADNPAGTSYNGASTSGERRCCDIPSNQGCQTATDTCDMQFYVCIGQLVNGKCVGAVSISSVFTDTVSLATCGPALLDYSQGKAYVSHPMVGAMRLTKKMADIQVIVKDSDLGGNSSDVIDVLGGIVSVSPGADVTNATSEDIALKNVVSIKLRLLFWCAPGHSGPLCKANNGTDHCFKGWHGDDCSLPTTPCSPNPCKNGGTCTPFHDGTFKCMCTEGYNGTICDSDIDECALGVCQHGATCQNLPGAFNCICPSGWDGLICTDKVPQCMPSPCQHGICQPFLGTNTNYTCKCDQDWTGELCSQKKTCTDTSCVHGKCTTVPGNLLCQCSFGYKGENCTEDIDECGANPCQHAGTCINFIGNFTCMCADGYGGKICSKNTTKCGSYECSSHGNCLVNSNDLRGHTCTCFPGYIGQRCETQVNYCQNVICKNNGTCTNFANDYLCNCSKFWSGRTCDVDINECKQSPCQHGAVCTNTAGSYSCACPAAWTGANCETDVNECQQKQHCKYGICSNTPGSYKCMCNEGYFGDHCTYRYNFCKNVTCSGRGSCVELVNNYHCQCDPGYFGDDCHLDVDECSQNICQHNATACANSPGSYNCTCANGWTGRNCANDFNECSVITPYPCNGNGICHNTVGSYKCQCFGGFVGADCDVIVNDCQSIKCVKGKCVTDSDGPSCHCEDGYEGIKCDTDINECEELDPCYNFGACTNTEGSYFCTCAAGWTGKSCEEDVDECKATVCQHGGACTNLIGSYLCACKQGWQGKSCEAQLSNSLTGSVIEVTFNQNITTNKTKSVVSALYQFLTKYVCNTKAPILYVEPASMNTLRFQASCANYSALSQTVIQSGYAAVSNFTKQFLFPMTLKQFQTIHVKVDTKSKSWISTNWPIFVGVLAAILIVFAVTFGCYRDRKNKRTRTESTDAFENPAFSGPNDFNDPM